VLFSEIWQPEKQTQDKLPPMHEPFSQPFSQVMTRESRLPQESTE